MARKALSVNTKNGERPGEAGALGLLAEVAIRHDPLAADEMENHLLSALAVAEPLKCFRSWHAAIYVWDAAGV
jgi:hypothetical protein